jgi:hypothetical protein
MAITWMSEKSNPVDLRRFLSGPKLAASHCGLISGLEINLLKAGK